MSKEVLNYKIPFTYREWQSKASKQYNRFTVVVCHRRAGKTYVNIRKQLEYLFSLPNRQAAPKRAAYIANTYAQAKDVAWGYYKQFLGGLPDTFVQFNEAELKIKFFDGVNGKVGTVISLYGAEKYHNLRGIYLDHCILDEYEHMSHQVFDEVISPMLDDYNGHCVITGTPNGKNDFFYKYNIGLDPKNEEWSSVKFDIYESNVYGEDWIKSKKAQYKYRPESWQQEYECSFEAASKGAIFAKEVSRMKQENRIVDQEPDPAYPVVAGLDLGFDGTAIWYIQKIGKQINIIDFDFIKDEDHTFVANTLMSKRYAYDHIIIGHDGAKRTSENKGKTRADIFRNFGFKVKESKRLPLLDAIAAGRQFLNKCRILKKCTEKRFKFEGSQSQPLDALSLYQFKVNDEGHSTGSEKNDDSNHVGEALRNLAVGLKSKYLEDFDVVSKNKYKYNDLKNRNKPMVSNQWSPLDRRNNNRNRRR